MTNKATAQNPVNQESQTTQNAIIKAHLLTGASITSFDSYRLYRITTLAQRIHDLRNSGLVIQGERAHKQQFYIYWLDEAALIEAKENDQGAENE